MEVRSRDKRTELALLVGIDVPGRAFGAPAPGAATGRLVALTEGGVRAASTTARTVLGIQKDGGGALPLQEVRLETPEPLDQDAFFIARGALQGFVVSAPRSGRENARNLGPAPISVTYMLGPRAMRRVITGFLSPDARVRHPYVGIFVRDAVNGGAEVVTTDPGSPARRAGVRPGDVLISLGGVPVNRQTDFLRALLELEPGRSAIAVVRRGATSVPISFTVAAADD